MIRRTLPGRSWILAWCVAGLWACSGPSGCAACGGFTPLPQGTYSGTKLNTAGSARLSAAGFTTLNANAPSILAFFAPGGVMQVPVPCSIQTTSLAGIPLVRLAIADTGTFGCNAESCGRMNGACDSAIDVGQAVTLTFAALTFAPRSPDILEAKVTATVSTGPIPISSAGTSAAALCFFAGRAKFTVDLNTARAPPTSTDLAIDIKFAIDTKWDQLLSLEVSDVGNTMACSGGVMPPNCIDPNDMEILNEGCAALNIASIGAVKSLLINQLTSSLKTQITKALADANCAKCGPMGQCPQIGTTAASSCEPDAGVCLDSVTRKCVPGLLGVEGRLEVGQALATLGAQPGSAIELSLGAGGSAAATTTGLTVGLRGGAKEVFVADCVAPVMRPAAPMLPLPDFEIDAPGPYDVGLSVSGQMLSEVLFRAQQSGALCLELGQESVSALESGLLATLLPSLGKLTGGQSVPLRIVIRPVKPPTAVVGEGTVGPDGKPLDPLVRLNWQGVEIDAYALLDDRQARLFTVAADLSLPLGVTLDGCSGVTPVVGSLTGAITNVQVKNSEILAEPLTVLQNLVPSLLTLAEPQLAMGLSGFTLPRFNGFQLSLVGARGIGQVSGTSTYNHIGLYADLLSGGMMCKRSATASTQLVRAASKSKDLASLDTGIGRQFSWRVDEGLWSTWQKADAMGWLQVLHPRLLLGGAHVIELRTPEGETQQVVVR